MATCPNKNTEAWQLLVTSRGEDVAHYLWDKYDGNVPESESRESIVKAGLKSIDILSSQKAKDVFSKGQKNNWPLDKTLSELQVPKEQKKLIIDSYNNLIFSNNEITIEPTLNEIVTDLLSKYSYAIEINTATKKERETFGPDYSELREYKSESTGKIYTYNEYLGWMSEGKEVDELPEDAVLIEPEKKPTSYYSNLTVPGGTNYTENEIATPAITPNIKGHAQFATDNGIGWFRSDEQLTKYEKQFAWAIEQETGEKEGSKTRRILEVQSDLFQKGRDKKGLTKDTTEIKQEPLPGEVGFFLETVIDKKKFNNTTSNQFLQLLNKDNNWVTFFIKSIIQDSTKKGYEKVLFPTGNTASKVEGHTTLEEFKREKEDRIKELENKKPEILEENGQFEVLEPTQGATMDIVKTREEAEQIWEKRYRQKYINEINQLKQELERIETEGFGALKPIYNFYENTVKNVLNKQYGKENVKQVTDEYGNTWNEIEIVPEREQQTILFQLPKENQKPASPQLIKLMKEFIKSIGVDYSLVTDIVVDGKRVDANGAALIMQKLIQVVEGKEDVALPEEAMHFAVEIIRQTNPKLYQQLLKEINNHPKLNEVISLYGNDPRYQKDGRRDIVKLKEEAIAQVLVDRLEDIVGRSWFERIVDWLKGLFFSRSGFDKASMDVLSGKIASVEDIDVSKGSIYFQLEKGEKVFNDLKDVSNRIQLNDGVYELDGEKAKRRVSDFAKEFYEKIFPDLGKTKFEEAVFELKAEKGTSGHADLEYAQKVLVDPETGLVREEELDDSSYISQLNPDDRKMYDLLKSNLKDRINSFPEGTRFMSEVRIFDKKRKIAGTVDFLSITPEGKVNILDWKFMDLNTDRYEDVPWYKVEAWRIQMGKYKDIIGSNYNVKNEEFGQTRMIPILAKYTIADYEKEILPRLKEIKIGDVVVQNIEEDFLLPVGITDEKTGNKKIDTLIEKLNNVYKKLAEEKVKDTERSVKAEQLNSLYKAIRHLQIKGNVVPLINQAKILNKQVSMLLNRYKEDFEGKDPSEINKDKINAFAGVIRIHLEALAPYLDLKQLRFLLEEDTEENNKLKDELRKTVEKVEDYISDLQELDQTFGEKFNNTSSTPEKVVKGITKWFSSISTIQVKNIQEFYKLANEAFFKSNQENLEEVERLTELKQKYTQWASAKGLSISEYFNILMKKDKNELIDEYDRKFYDELKTKIAKKDYDWISENIDVDAYREYIDQKIEEEIQQIFSRPEVGTEEEVKNIIKKKIAKVYSKYDLENRNSNGWFLNKEIKKFPKRDKWESEEWKELNKPENAPAKEFYDYIVERNKYYQSIEYLNGKSARKFLPWVRQGFIEGLVFGAETKGIGEQFLRNISMDEAEAGFGQTDPITGELVNSIPKYFTKDLGEGYSTDLFKTMALYNQYAIRFKNLKSIEERSLQLLRAERNKKSIMTSQFGKLIKENGELKLNPNNEENSKLLEDMIKSIVYQQKYLQSETFDMTMGKLSGFGKTLNEKLGLNIFPENIEGRELSVNKTIDTLNTQFQMVTLGLNSLSAISNFFGGNANGLINAGKYFTKTELIKTQMWMFASKMQGKVFGKNSLSESPAKALAALDFFLPFVDNYNKDAAKNLSLTKIDQQQIQDFLMYFMRKGDEAVQTINFFAFLQNAVVINGEIVNAREYLKNTEEYRNFYKGTQQERKERKDKFEKDVNELIDSKGVLTLGEIVDGKFVIPGIDKKSDTVMNFRRLVQSFTSDALGSMSEDNRRLINMNVYGSSFMVFKNWIPRLVDVRVGDLKYNAASDAYEWGRMRMLFGMLTTDIGKSTKSLMAAIGGDGDVWLNQVRELYERKQKEYYDNTGKELEMTEDEFISLVNQNIKNQAVDLAILLTMMSLLLGLKALAPDDDEDPIVKNQYKFLLKATDKLTDELSYFYDPTSIPGLISKGAFPSIGLLENYGKLTRDFALENFGLIIGDEEMRDDAKPIKYLMKSFPMSSQAASYLPMFYPELAKDLGIKMQSQYGMR